MNGEQIIFEQGGASNGFCQYLQRVQEHYSIGSGDNLGLRPGVTRGVQLNYDADNDRDGNNLFEDSIGSLDNTALTNQFDWLLNGVTRVAVSDQMAAITNAYRFNGSATAVMRSVHYAAGYANQRDATIEMVFKPQDFEGDEVLFESGGTVTGTTLALTGSRLRLYVRYNTAVIADAQFDLSELSTMRRGGFIHPVATIDIANSNLCLYVNGELQSQATANGAILEWSGYDGAGLGCINEACSFPSPLNKFAGDIAILRLYPTLLDGAQIQANYLSLQPKPVIRGTFLMVQ
ncbi:MAG: hypothetical protein PHO37_07315 [Kiritimatiellae bacterium]|nr:hypothetical protein [Kiritimatiellia bacterium]